MMNDLLHDDSKSIRFITGFILVGFGLFFLMYTNQQKLISRPVNSLTAHSVKALAEIFSFESSVEDLTYIRERGNDKIFVPTTLLRVGNYKARVILECSAVHAGILLFSFLLAYPASLSQKISGMIFLIPCLVAFNTVRIFILMLLGHYFGQNSTVFNLFHVYIMQVLIIALTLALTLVWLRRYELRKIDYPIWFFLRFLTISAGFTILWFVSKNKFNFDSGIIESSIFPFLTFGSLVLSNSDLSFRKSYKEILTGFSIMFAFLITGQGARLAYEHFHSPSAELSFVMVNSALKYLLPFGLFIFLIRKKIFIRTNHFGKQIFGCPLCDKKNIRNLRAHAMAKHNTDLMQKNERLMEAIQINEAGLETE